METRPLFGLVLGGGGARGAYEAGVLRYIAAALPAALGARFRVIVGTSAGAINGAWAAAGAADPGRSADDLLRIWNSLDIPDIYRLGLRQLWRVPMTVLTGRRSRGEIALADASPLRALLRGSLDWSAIGRCLDSGALEAFAVTATELATSRNVVFFQSRRAQDGLLRSVNPFVRPKPVRMGPEHVLASAAIPLLFPPVKVDGRWYADGGLGQNTPLRPAIRLGADRLLVISLRRTVSLDEGEALAQRYGGVPPSWAQVIGKTMNTVLLDKAAHEVTRIERTNRLIAWGRRRYGDAFAQELGEAVAGERGVPYRELRALLISPSVDLGALATRVAESQEFSARVDGLTRRMLGSFARATGAADNDLLSYLLFTPPYLRELMRLGEADAAARHDELVEFFTP